MPGPTSPNCDRAAADPERICLLETSEQFPRTLGIEPQYRHAMHVDEVDIIVEGDYTPINLADAPTTDVEEAIAAFALPFIADGATLQTGIGGIPNTIATALAEGPGSGLRRALGDVHERPDAALPGRQGHQREQGCLRRLLGHDVRRRSARAVRVARRQRGGPLPPGRDHQLARDHQRQRQHDHDQRCDGGRPVRPGRRRHDRGQPVLRHRRPRGLRGGCGARAQRPLPRLPSVVDVGRRRARVADHAEAADGLDRHHAASHGRRRDHRDTASPNSAG